MLKGIFKCGSRRVKGCLKEVSSVFEGSFREMLRVFQVLLKGISINFKGVSRVFEKSSKGMSGNFQWCFKKVLKDKKVSRKFHESFKGISRVFQGRLKAV